MTRRRSDPHADLIRYLDRQVAELRAELARTQAELEEYRQADAFGWDIVNERKNARAEADHRAELAHEEAEADAAYAALAFEPANGKPANDSF